MNLKQVLARSHYWLSSGLGFLISLIILDERGAAYYAGFAISALYVNTIAALFSTKAFLYLISSHDVCDVKGIFLKEFLLKVVGVVLGSVLASELTSDFDVLKIFIVYHSFLVILKISDPLFEFRCIKNKDVALFSKVQVFFRFLYSFGLAYGLYLYDAEFFLIFGVGVATLEAFVKIYLSSGFIWSWGDGAEGGQRAESNFVYIVQNFFGVFNKQFDVFILMWFVEDVGRYAPYVFVKQVGAIVMIATQPITHLYYIGVDKTKLFLFCLLLSALAMLGMEVLALFYERLDFVGVARNFYLIWLVGLGSCLLPLLIAKSGKFKYQMVISFICSGVLMLYLYFTFNTSEDISNELVWSRLLIVLLAVVLQVSFIYRLSKLKA